ncbi:MAG: SUMF1/EgtB/PvdO family nonheme iron enzyme [Planctomycetaceae bacterium]|nr:SUMF1/EgtB/PvdO family nonheme iron enzyme [Planctomycetaceae bacterium]
MNGRTRRSYRSALLGLAATPLLALSATAQVVPYGSGVNPPGSLVVLGGSPAVGENFTVGVSNPTSASAAPGLAFLSIASAPDLAFPAGTVLAGFGLAAPGAPGELLLSLSAPNPLVTLGPVVWNGGANPPANFALSVPLLPSLAGVTLYLQGSLLDLAGIPSLGVTNGLAVTLSEPDFPGLALIQPGSFVMGSDAPNFVSPYYNDPNSQPVHPVTITRPYWMGRFEVTQGQYEALMGDNPSYLVGANRPVESVTWFEAVAYCDALNAQQTALGKVPPGYVYRLPTEAEWEYACRAGSTTEFHYGGALVCSDAKFFSSYHAGGECGTVSTGTATVGSYAPNAWGLYDMHGNVWEWCMDKMGPYSAAAQIDPFANGAGSSRVLRGGGWYDVSSDCRSAKRFPSNPLITGFLDGFRVVLGPVLAP